MRRQRSRRHVQCPPREASFSSIPTITRVRSLHRPDLFRLLFFSLFLANLHWQIINYTLSEEVHYGNLGVVKQGGESLLFAAHSTRRIPLSWSLHEVANHRRRIAFWTTSLVELRHIPAEGWEWLRIQTLYETATGPLDLTWGGGESWGPTSRWPRELTVTVEGDPVSMDVGEGRHNSCNRAVNGTGNEFVTDVGTVTQFGGGGDSPPEDSSSAQSQASTMTCPVDLRDNVKRLMKKSAGDSSDCLKYVYTAHPVNHVTEPESITSGYTLTPPLNEDSYVDKHGNTACCFRVDTDLSISGSGYASLIDGSKWLGTDVITNTLCLLARTLGVGFAKIPPHDGKREWIADGFMAEKWRSMREENGQRELSWNFYLNAKYDAGVTGEYCTQSRSFSKCTPDMKEALRSRAKHVDQAIIPFNPNNAHWIFACVQFQESTIILVNSIYPWQKNLYDWLEMVRHWATAVKRVRGQDDSGQFRILEMTTRTQFDGFECGVHTIVNSLSYVCGWNKVLPHGHTHHSRLWISMLLWLSSDNSIQLSRDQLDKLPEIVKPHVRSVQMTLGLQPSYICTPCGNKQDLMLQIVRVFKDLCCLQATVGPIREAISNPPVPVPTDTALKAQESSLEGRNVPQKVEGARSNTGAGDQAKNVQIKVEGSTSQTEDATQEGTSKRRYYFYV